VRSVVAAFLLLVGLAGAGIVRRVSVDSLGREGNGPSGVSVYLVNPPAITPDGRFVAFESAADNLVPGDTNGAVDVFLHDGITGRTERVSLGSGGAQGNGHSGYPGVSDDGRWVVFSSGADDLVPGDLNGFWDVFVRDRQDGTTRRVSVAGSSEEANRHCQSPDISADGRIVAFLSAADNLVAGDTNAVPDVFIHDRAAGTTERISISSLGAQADGACFGRAALSADGRYVAFQCAATNLVPNDTNAASDIFVRDRVALVTTRVSTGPGGVEANDGSSNPSMTGDGQLVAFDSGANNLHPHDRNSSIDVFVHDRATGVTEVVTRTVSGGVASQGGWESGIARDGLSVTFRSSSADLLPGEMNAFFDVYLRDLVGRRTIRLTTDAAGVEGNRDSLHGRPASGGRAAVISSLARNLVPGDTNNQWDVFVRDLYPTLAPVDRPRLGTVFAILLSAPEDAAAVYVAGASTGYTPGLELTGRYIPLNPDQLFFLSLTTPAIFLDFAGTLDGAGGATIRMAIPAEPVLVGWNLYVAFVTQRSMAPPGVSEALRLVIGS